MTDNLSVKPPLWFWIVSAVALIWNIMGVMAYLSSAFMTDEMKTELPPEQVALLDNTPAWVTAAFAIAVWAGLLGCIALLIRKKWARPVLVISLIGIIAQMSYSFFMSNASEVYGQVQGVIMPIFVIVIGAVLVLVAKKATNKHWLR